MRKICPSPPPPPPRSPTRPEAVFLLGGGRALLSIILSAVAAAARKVLPTACLPGKKVDHPATEYVQGDHTGFHTGKTSGCCLVYFHFRGSILGYHGVHCGHFWRISMPFFTDIRSLDVQKKQITLWDSFATRRRIHYNTHGWARVQKGRSASSWMAVLCCHTLLRLSS